MCVCVSACQVCMCMCMCAHQGYKAPSLLYLGLEIEVTVIHPISVLGPEFGSSARAASGFHHSVVSPDPGLAVLSESGVSGA